MQYVREALNALGGRRLQVFLATFGVAVGVASMVFLVAIVAGVHRLVLEQARMRGAGLLILGVEPPRRGMWNETPPLTLTAADADALAFGSAGLGRTSPSRNISVQSARFGPDQTSINLTAVGESYLDMTRLPLKYGRGLTADDLASRRRVVVIGAGVARELFGAVDPLGQSLQVGDWSYDVVGVLGWQVEDNPERVSYADRRCLIPYTTAHETFVYPDQADSVFIEIVDAETHAESAVAVKAQLVHRRGFSETQAGWLRVYDSVERTAEMNLIMLAMKTLVGLVGSIGLFVGAVGVMNIMIVSVTQRTSEIGLRRAVGARASWIRRQFLIESVMVTGVGGSMGLIGAIVLTWAVRLLPLQQEFPKPYISAVTVLVALGVILLTGIAAGVTPAVRASRITPVDALRHE
jgi:putative ABC transport system permease protein